MRIRGYLHLFTRSGRYQERMGDGTGVRREQKEGGGEEEPGGGTIHEGYDDQRRRRGYWHEGGRTRVPTRGEYGGGRDTVRLSHMSGTVYRSRGDDVSTLLLRNVHVDQGEGGGDGMSDLFQGYARRVEFSAKAGE